MHRLVLIIAAIIVTGCTPYVGYTHLSQPNVDDDGFDLICGGFETQKRHVRGDIAGCENLARSGTETYIRADIRVLIY